MRRTIKTIGAAVALAAALGCAGGCQDTARSRKDAKELAGKLTAYRDEQDERVRRLNEEYRDTFAKLMDTLDDLSRAELQQARDGDAQRVADSLIADGNASLRSRFRGSFADAVREQRKRIADADLAVATVRENYGKAYADARLEIAKVNTAIKNVAALAADPDDHKRLQQVVKVVEAFAKAIQEAEKQAKAAAGTGTATP
jgi:hypothetical protein